MMSRQRGGAGEVIVLSPPIHFGLWEKFSYCRKIFFKMQNLELKRSVLEEFRCKIEISSTLLEICSCLLAPPTILAHDAAGNILWLVGALFMSVAEHA